jgi:hypothetical protein
MMILRPVSFLWKPAVALRLMALVTVREAKQA